MDKTPDYPTETNAVQKFSLNAKTPTNNQIEANAVQQHMLNTKTSD